MVSSIFKTGMGLVFGLRPECVSDDGFRIMCAEYQKNVGNLDAPDTMAAGSVIRHGNDCFLMQTCLNRESA